MHLFHQSVFISWTYPRRQVINSCQCSKRGGLPLLYCELKQPTNNLYHSGSSTKTGIINELDNVSFSSR